MSILAAWFVFPLVLALLCAGLGLLVDNLSGRRLPGVLILPVGLAALVAIAQFTTLTDASAGLTVPTLCFLTVLGAGFALPWRFSAPDALPIAAAVGVFAVFAAPVVLSGDPTFAGYIKLDDTATWLALTDRVMEHGRDLGGLEPSTYRATLEANLPKGYPVGVFLPFGAAEELVGGDLAWVFQPYLTFLAAMLSLCLWSIAATVIRRPALRAVVAFIAAQPALLFGYALWGGVKEMGAAVFVALAAALAPTAIRSGANAGNTLPLAAAAGALVGVLSLGGLVWLGPMLVVLAFLGVRTLGPRAMVRQGLAFVVAVAVFAVPIFLAGGFNPFQSGLTSESEMGNLISPLDPLQALGIWPSGDFRVSPHATIATAVLIALGLLALLLGLWAAWRRRAVAALLYASALIACVAIVAVGSPWIDGKALATAAPVALTLAISGAAASLRIDRLTGLVLIVLIGGAVLWSNVLAYGGADLAPYNQLAELQQIGEAFRGQGPTLMTEYNPYGARHFLRELDGEGASELRVREVPLRSGGAAEKGESVDTDQVDLNALLEYRTLVLRRSPVRSRPPSPYRLIWSGRYYEVWQRPEGYAGPVPTHLSLGEEFEPSAIPDCGEVTGLGELPLLHGMKGARVLAARHAPVYDATKGTLTVPRPGDYKAWLLGSARGAIELWIEGQKVGEVRQELENEGGFMPLGTARLEAGTYRVKLHFDGADLHPGSGGFPRPETGPLLFSPAGDEAGELISVPVTESSRLCGKRWDWIEALGSS